MATIVNHNPGAFSLAAFLTPLRGFLRRLSEISEGARCAREVAELSALTDAELAEKGVAREDIVRHAFRRHLVI